VAHDGARFSSPFAAAAMRAGLAEYVRAATEAAVGAAPPAVDRHIERLRVRIPANADARTMRETLRRAIAAELGRKP
jgi:hypothetical protein